MPKPGGRSKGKKGKRGPRPSLPVDEIDEAEGWAEIVDILCSHYDLPDLTTCKGLKTTSGRFDNIYRKLDDAYDKYISNERVRGGIVAIYSKMCVDPLLRKRLFEKCLLGRLVPLLDIEQSRNMALRALASIAQRAGLAIRADVARSSDVFTRLVDAHPDDHILAEQVLKILRYCITACMGGAQGSPTFPDIIDSINLTKVLNTTIHCMVQSSSYEFSAAHGLHIIAASTVHGHKAFKGAPEASKILVAGLRSADWTLRCVAFGGLVNLDKPGALIRDGDQLNPQALGAVMKRMPKDISDALTAYGPERCDIFLTMRAVSRLMQAMTVAFPATRDLCSLGMTLYENIRSTEYSVFDGGYHPVPGVHPFARWSDSLLVCAKALRARNRPGDKDIANVLEIKHMVMHGDPDAGAIKGYSCLPSNFDFAYYHYAMSVAGEPVSCLRPAKQGMLCEGITPFIKSQLLQRAVEHGAEAGLGTLRQAPTPGTEKWHLGIAYLQSALDDARRFLDEAPPDNRYMKNMAYWFVILTVMVSKNVDQDLPEIKSALDRLKIADAVSDLVGTGPPDTIHRRVQGTIRRLFKASIQKYGTIFDYTATERPKTSEAGACGLKDDLGTWLSTLTAEDGEEMPYDGIGPGEGGHASGERPIERTELYKCSACGYPSTFAKKCRGCAKARYCDGFCEEKHWPEHQRDCNA